MPFQEEALNPVSKLTLPGFHMQAGQDLAHQEGNSQACGVL